MNKRIKICLDLNIWCAALLAERKNRKNTACQSLVQIIKTGQCLLGQTELVISWGMLNRLEKVLIKDLKISPNTAQLYLNSIKSYTQLSPQLTLGGTGVIPLHDTEDAYVLETALSGKAEILVTANFKDFITKDTKIIIDNRHGIYQSANQKCQIIHPYLAVKLLI
jgi:predicted nucleic acid-binding protein